MTVLTRMFIAAYSFATDRIRPIPECLLVEYGATFGPPDNAAAVRNAISSNTAAVIVEPIQGEGGVRPIPTATAAVLADVCATTGTLLVADEASGIPEEVFDQVFRVHSGLYTS